MPSNITLAGWGLGGLLLATTIVFAQNPAPGSGFPGPGTPDTLRIQTSRTTGLAAFLTRVDGAAIGGHIQREVGESGVNVFLREYGHHFGITDPQSQLEVTKVDTDRQGYVHTTHRQLHEGVPVFSGVVKVHERPDGAVHAANGDFYPVSGKLSVVPVLGLADAVAAARVDSGRADAAVEKAELVIVDPAWYGEVSTGHRLAYQVVLNDGFAFRRAHFIDAHTGETLDAWSMIHGVRDRAIYFGDQLSVIPGTLARSEGAPATGDADIDAAYDFYGDTYDFYLRAFGRDSIDGNGMTMIATTHSTAPTCPNAFWNGTQMVFCTGTVTDDVVGHELTHGVTEFTAGLVYRNQSGQLNESFSDVFGELIDLFNGDAAFVGAPGGLAWPTHPSGTGTDIPNDERFACSPRPSYPEGVRWLVAEDASAFGGAIRDMWNPPCRSSPDFANSVLQTCAAGDNGGVHRGSGIPNHAFAMLTDGKSFNGRVVTGIGPIKSGAVWYRALSVYLTVASDFEDAYIAFNQAAQDLVGTFPPDPRTGLLSPDMFSAFDAAQVDEALLAVEMNTPGACGEIDHILLAASPVFCEGVQVVFSENFESGAPGWTVMNTAGTTPYDWELRSTDLPLGHPGTAWFVADPNIGNCSAQNEFGVHSLTSPTLPLPATSGVYRVAFSHYVSTEGAWDGGNLKLSVNGGPFFLVPPGAFEHNPYNGALRSTVSGNSNPLAGENAWTGAGGGWGASVVNLAGLATGGDSIELRFELGKDGCVGGGGWYVDDLLLLRCPDHDDDGVSDFRDAVFIAAAEPAYGVGTGVLTSTSFTTRRKAAGDVTLHLTAYADLANTDEYIDVSVDGVFVGRLFEISAADCSYWPNRGELVVSRAAFNLALTDAVIRVAMQGSAAVNAASCGADNYVTVAMSYPQVSAGDFDGDGTVGITDFLAVLAMWGPCAICLEDIDGDGAVGIEEFLIVLANWGAAPPSG